MDTERKPFNQETFDKNDEVARKVVKRFLLTKGIEATDNPKKHGIDLVIPKEESDKNPRLAGVTYEVERRSIWAREWPYSTVHIPERKTKFLQNKMVYAVVNKQLDSILFCPAEEIRDCPLREIPNKAVAQGEYFYDVPFEKWTMREVSDCAI